MLVLKVFPRNEEKVYFRGLKAERKACPRPSRFSSRFPSCFVGSHFLPDLLQKCHCVYTVCLLLDLEEESLNKDVYQ